MMEECPSISFDGKAGEKCGMKAVSNVPLQVSLYFNLIFLPFWSVTYVFMVPIKFDGLSLHYKYILCLAFSTALLIEVLRIYIGYKGNLQEKVSELAGFWLITILLQIPLQLFLLFSTGLQPSLLETIVQTIMCLFFLIQSVSGILALRNASRNSVLSFQSGSGLREKHEKY